MLGYAILVTDGKITACEGTVFWRMIVTITFRLFTKLHKTLKSVKIVIVQVRCLAPVEDRNAKALILGSMPGKASLCAKQYYAHPRNPFWKIMGQLVGATPQLSYEVRTGILKASGIALWDVLESCFRSTSSDSDIKDASLVVNDFDAFYREHPQIIIVYFNGGKAAALYLRRVVPTIGPHLI